MLTFGFRNGALAGLLLFGSQLCHAQATPGVSGTAVTTGMVGMTNAQTARLNVINLQPVIPGVAAVACPVTLLFYDETGAPQKQLTVTNIAPATSTSLEYKPALRFVEFNGRWQIRAVVFTSSTTALPTEPTSTTPTGCNVMASLEIFDDPTGETRTFTTDLKVMPGFRLLAPPVTTP